jgi:predicted Zn-dependent peptidase
MAVERVEVQKTEQPLAGIFIGFDSHSIIGEPTQATLDMADTLTSGYGYPTGYIFETLRGRGLVYEADAQNWAGVSESVPGAFFAYAGCDPKNVNQVIDLILENVARLQGTPADIQENWFGRSKQLVVTSEAMGSETASQQATVAALDELYGLGYAWHEKFAERINAVTLEAVRAVGKERLSRCVVTVSTPEPEVVKVKTGKREYESFPPVDLTPRGVQHDVGK